MKLMEEVFETWDEVLYNIEIPMPKVYRAKGLGIYTNVVNSSNYEWYIFEAGAKLLKEK